MESLHNYLSHMSLTAILVILIGGFFLLAFLFDYKELRAKKIPTFSAEPPYPYQVIGDREIFVEATSYQHGIYLLSKKAFTLKADAIKDFKITTLKKGKNEKIMLSGLPITRI